MGKEHQFISIIVPIKNAIKTTAVCLDSITKYTDNYELIIIDDGSRKETSDYIDKFIYAQKHDCQVKDDRIKLIRNEKSVGWCKAINQGIDAVGQSEYIVFCNSDTGMTPLWDYDMIKLFEDNSDLGVLSPETNSISGSQKKIDTADKTIWKENVDSLIFFFVMIRRSALEQVGKIDERFGLGGQDDTDYCIRAKSMGWDVSIARNVFIYHYGSASFREEFDNNVQKSIDYAQSRKEILNAKYKRPRVMIGVPNGGKLATTLALNLIKWVNCGRYDINLNMPGGLFPLDNARNTIVKDFLELDYDYLWWIDDDITPPVDALDKLIAADKDIIGGVGFSYREDDGQFFTYPVTLRYNENKEYVVYYGNGKSEVEEIDATGGACILYKRKVYEMLERPYEFSYHRDGTLSLTCDFKIFQKCQAMGIKLYVDYSIHCKHLKMVDLLKVQSALAKVKFESEEKYNELLNKYNILCNELFSQKANNKSPGLANKLGLT